MSVVLLAQSAAKPQALGPFFVMLGVLIVVIGAASIALVWYRRKVLGRESSEQQSAMLDGLRAMRARGEISDEEYDAARKSMAARIAGVPPPHPPAPQEPSKTSSGGNKGLVARPGFDLTGAPLPRQERKD